MKIKAAKVCKKDSDVRLFHNKSNHYFQISVSVLGKSFIFVYATKLTNKYVIHKQEFHAR